MTSNAPVAAAAEGLPKFPGYEAAFRQLEWPIIRARKMAKLQVLLAEAIDEGGTSDFVENASEALSFMVDETFHVIDEIETLWLKLHNAGCDAERRTGQ